jgi:hypothetical protein
VPLRDRYGTRASGDSRPSTEQSSAPQYALAATLVALIALLGGLYWKSESLKVEIDKETLCPLKQAPAEVLVVLLDVSDQLSEPQLIKIENEVERLRDTLPRWGRIEIYVVARGGERLTVPVIQLCNPGTGDDMNDIYQNPDLAQKRWQAFAQVLRDRITALMHLPDTGTSPIFESIQAVSLRTFDRPDMDGVPKRLVVVSDLMQNVPGALSHYRGVPDFEEFAASPYFSMVRGDLDSVDVTLLYLNRSELPVQGTEHISFWAQYFAAQGATVHEVKKVFGDQ